MASPRPWLVLQVTESHEAPHLQMGDLVLMEQLL